MLKGKKALCIGFGIASVQTLPKIGQLVINWAYLDTSSSWPVLHPLFVPPLTLRSTDDSGIGRPCTPWYNNTEKQLSSSLILLQEISTRSWHRPVMPSTTSSEDEIPVGLLPWLHIGSADVGYLTPPVLGGELCFPSSVWLNHFGGLGVDNRQVRDKTIT